MQNTKNARDLFFAVGDFKTPLGDVREEDGLLIYEAEEYLLKSQTEKHPSGVISRKDTFQNISGRPLTLRGAMSLFTYNDSEYEVYTQNSQWIEESVGMWQPLHTAISAENTDVRYNCSAAPFVALFDRQSGRGVAYHILANSLWRLRVNRRFTCDSHATDVVVSLGINSDHFSYTVQPGETFAFPEILFYPFQNKTDMDAYKLHRYAKERYPAKELPVIYNSWMYRFDHFSFDSLVSQIDTAKALGAEYFVVDAGWFGKEGEWTSTIGDWGLDGDGCFHGRLDEFPSLVRERGLKFGIWFEIERATHFTKNYQNRKELYTAEKGFTFVDFTNPEAVDYIFEILSDRIRKYGIEFIKFDFNVVPDTDKNGDAFLAYFKGHTELFRRLKATFPNLYLQLCAGGGLRMALPHLDQFSSCWMSDNHSLREQLDIYKNTMLRMPCRTLEHWITIEGIENFRQSGKEHILSCADAVWESTQSITPDFLKYASLGGPIGISCDVNSIPENTFRTLKEHIAKFKEEREFFKNAECRLLTDTEGMLVMQFSDEAFAKLKILVFSHKNHQKAITVYPVLDKDAVYTVSGETPEERQGTDLNENGVDLALLGKGRAMMLDLSKKTCKNTIKS